MTSLVNRLSLRRRLLAVRHGRRDLQRAADNAWTLHAHLGRVDHALSHLPDMGGWSLDLAGARLLLDTVRQLAPATVVEFGPGTSTAVLAACRARFGFPTSILSFEHDPSFFTELDELWTDIDAVQVHCAPLDNDGWYDRDIVRRTLADHVVDLAVVDGPPAGAGSEVRALALEELRRGGAPPALVLDDVDRVAEDRLVRRLRTEGWTTTGRTRTTVALTPP